MTGYSALPCATKKDRGTDLIAGNTTPCPPPFTTHRAEPPCSFLFPDLPFLEIAYHPDLIKYRSLWVRHEVIYRGLNAGPALQTAFGCFRQAELRAKVDGPTAQNNRELHEHLHYLLPLKFNL